MIDLINTAPLVVDEKNNIMPEIRIAKGTVLCIEYPINIYSPSIGLNHQGEGGSFTYYFKKRGAHFRLVFTKKALLFDKLDLKHSVIESKSYDYGDLLRFIKKCNKDKSLLYRSAFEKAGIE